MSGSAVLVDELRQVIHKLDRRLRGETSGGEYTSSQRSVLSLLMRRGPMTLSDLARAEGMRPQSMRTIVSALDEAGLVTGAPHPTDGRQTLLSVSDPTRATILANRVAKNDWLSRSIAANLSPAEQDALPAAIALLQRLVGD